MHLRDAHDRAPMVTHAAHGMFTTSCPHELYTFAHMCMESGTCTRREKRLHCQDVQYDARTRTAHQRSSAHARANNIVRGVQQRHTSETRNGPPIEFASEGADS